MSVVKDRDFLSVPMAQLSVGKVDNTIHWLHLYPVDNAIGDLHDDVFWLLVTTTRILQGFASLCKLGLLLFKPRWDNKILKWEVNEMDWIHFHFVILLPNTTVW